LQSIQKNPCHLWIVVWNLTFDAGIILKWKKISLTLVWRVKTKKQEADLNKWAILNEKT
jgi:hypothetical protein